MGTGCIENSAPSIALLQRQSRPSRKSVVAEEASTIAARKAFDIVKPVKAKKAAKAISENHRQAIDFSKPAKAERPQSSFLHQIVGMDGVLMLSLPRDDFERFNYSQHLLWNVGISPTKFIATDGNGATPEVLAQGCLLGDDKGSPLKGASGHTCGSGCGTKVEQAIAESHRQALTAALYRENNNWTAIFEDDAVPVLPESGAWDSELKRIWSQLPKHVGMIRLGWCEPGEDVSEPWGGKFTGYGGNWTDNWFDADLAQPLNKAIGTFMWTRATRIGGCTTAYMVHKRIIPDLLRIFPCCSPLDSCLEWDYFSKHQATFINLDVQGSDAYIQQNGDHRFGVSRGVLMQAWRQLGSARQPTAERWADQEIRSGKGEEEERGPMLTSAGRGVRVDA